MGITIKQHQGKWRIEIDHEEWEFESREILDKSLKEILDIKQQGGRIKY